jgi:Cu(I)/Ag(I) efflux system membrane protein CusA/SilA
MIETTVTLKPRSQWRDGMTKNKLIAEMNQAMQVVGYVNSWTQPINTRVMMQDTGIQTPVGIKVKGADLATVQEVAQQVETLLTDFPGTQSVIAERISQGYFVDAQLDFERMAQRGVTMDEALPTVRFAIGGDNVIGIRQPDKTVVPLAIQYSPEYIDTLEKVRNTPVITATGESVALSEIANVEVREAPEMIRNDNGELAGYIYVYLRDITAPEYVDRAREHLRTHLQLPAGYSVEWTGLYQYAEEARATLGIDHAGNHVHPADPGVPLRRRQLADHAVGTVRARRRHLPAVATGVLDDDRGDHRLRLAFCGRDPDRDHHDRIHS